MTDEQQQQKAHAAVPEVGVAVDTKAVETKAVEIPADASAATTPTATTPPSGTSLGGRVRKTTQKFTFVASKADEAEEFVPPVGKGTKVRDITFVGDKLAELGKKQLEMTKQLYSVMYGRRFQQKNLKVIKEHILEFSGICEQDDKSREHLVGKIGKWKRTFVQDVMDLLAVDRSKKSFDEQGKPFGKEELIDRLIDWLYNPQNTELGEKKAKAEAKAEAKLARKRAKRAKAKTTKAKTAGQPAKKKRKTTKKVAAEGEDDEDEEEAEAEHEATESEAEDSSSDFDEAQKATKKRRTTSRQAKKSRVVESDEDEAEEEDKVEEEDDEVEEQPAAEPETTEAKPNETQKPKPATTLAPEVCEKVRDIIAHGNAEELTVKKIVRQLSDDMGRDMMSEKKAIKEFITDSQM